jgi:quercetin dioxygenase-like cupin family protein
MKFLAKSLCHADKSWTFLDGSTRTAGTLDSVAIGRGEYLPGWRWSLHVGRQTGKGSAAHIGCVLSGQLAIRSFDGEEITVSPGEAFEIGPGHDAWVVGNETCVALDFETLN